MKATKRIRRVLHHRRSWTLLHGDCQQLLPLLPAASVDSVVTDPPAGISFMDKQWDTNRGGRRHWIHWLRRALRKCYRALKPGGHALVWAIPRTSHWTATALEDAGFEIRDCVYHFFGSGFPKSLDVSKAIDKAAGAQRKILAANPNRRRAHVKGARGFDKALGGVPLEAMDLTAPTTAAAKRWAGWGTALKPAVECWWLARKPLKGAVVVNVLRYDTGALNIDGCRIDTGGEQIQCSTADPYHAADGSQRTWRPTSTRGMVRHSHAAGRWPAHLVLSHTPACRSQSTREVSDCSPECPVQQLDKQSGELKTTYISPHHQNTRRSVGMMGKLRHPGAQGFDDSGGASRFFYCAKASRSERDRGCSGFHWDMRRTPRLVSKSRYRRLKRHGKPVTTGNIHPTVKSLSLMRWLCRLITPPRGIVLDCFSGSGSTGCAAMREHFRFIGIEEDRNSYRIARTRIRYHQQHTATPLFHSKAKHD